MSTAVRLPHWDMSVVYPSLESEEFQRDFARVKADIIRLGEMFDRLGIDRRDSATVDGSVVAAFEEVFPVYNQLNEFLATVYAYIRSFVTTDSSDAVAQSCSSEMEQALVPLSSLDNRLTSWIGSLDVKELMARSGLARDLEYLLRRTRESAAHLMPLAEEDLATELQLSGGSAWERLWNDVTSQMLVPVEVRDGQTEQVPMTVIRNMAYDADRAVRERAYVAEIAAWKTVATPLAAAINSIKGASNTLTAHRNWESGLEQSLFNNSIDRQTLDAMMEAAHASFPDFRRYLHAKARALGVDRLAWFDLFAPLGSSEQTWEYDTAHRFLVDQFARYSETLSSFVDRAFNERWIDAEPRVGKRGGAFCMALRGDESRVLTNYMPTYDGVSTLAHELGHAYHNFVKASRLYLQRRTPMTLAETASIFCETITEHAALAGATTHEQIAILEQSIQGSCQVVVDITSRFEFERGVFEQRRRRTLSIEELNELMLDAQRQTYGDGLDPAALHPYMWAVKPHYYSTDRPFYNYPYMFGLLFGLGLYARYQADPDRFRQGYDDLLAATGIADAATLAERFGIDIRTPEFWHASLDVVRGNIDRFERLIAESAGA